MISESEWEYCNPRGNHMVTVALRAGLIFLRVSLYALVILQFRWLNKLAALLCGWIYKYRALSDFLGWHYICCSSPKKLKAALLREKAVIGRGRHVVTWWFREHDLLLFYVLLVHFSLFCVFLVRSQNFMIKVKLWLIVEPYISLYLGNLVISHLSLILSFGPIKED